MMRAHSFRSCYDIFHFAKWQRSGQRDKQGQFINLLIAGKFNNELRPLFGERHRVLIVVDRFVPSMLMVNTTISLRRVII